MNYQIFSWFSFFSLLFVLNLLVVIQVPRVSCNPDEWYVSCGNTFNCGTITGVGYPFRGIGDPEYCGYPGFVLNCDQENVTTIAIMNISYSVLDIYQDTQVMKIVREDLMQTSCPRDLVNTTLDYSIFDYANTYMNLTFLYGCPPSSNFPGLSLLSCRNNNVYVFPGTLGPGSCNTSVIVPVLQTGPGSSVSLTSLNQVLQEGFEVRWTMDSKACSECTGSKGRCGYDFPTNQTTCFCLNAPYVASSCKTANGSSPGSMPTPPGMYSFLFDEKFWTREPRIFLVASEMTSNLMLAVGIVFPGHLVCSVLLFDLHYEMRGLADMMLSSLEGDRVISLKSNMEVKEKEEEN
ncbi:unnamed protein product [Ilex paraguariensis]|uniref:non-specific serine/threonine protein kinase n=1 Tax=Ilex paraguariensis TaxID=185542 RepID=A0ABC8R9C8_9AQUA